MNLLNASVRGILIASALAAGSSYLHAQQEFVERPGAMEFSGEMLARPLQPEALMDRGLTRAQAEATYEASVDAVQPFLKEVLVASDIYVLSLPQNLNENEFSQWMLNIGDFEYVEPNWTVYPIAIPNDTFYGSQWQHPRIDSPEAWDIHTGTSSHIAAFVDTGVDLDHPDLQGSLVSGYNSVNRLPQSSGGDVNDINGHGTFVGGCIGAIGNNNQGVAGVCWTVSLMPIRTSNSSGGGASLADIIDGATWAATNGARTVSASYTGVQSSSVGTAGTTLKNLGALFFYAADNFNQQHNFDWLDTIVVGATDQSDNKASFSSYGRAIDVTGPGVSVWSTVNGASYGAGSGTSFSTPIANGVTALLWSLVPSLTPNQAEGFLFGSCDDIGAPGEDDIFGHGRVNAHQAVLDAQGGPGPLTYQQPVPGTAGLFNTFTAINGTPGQTVTFWWAKRTGTSSIPGCAATLGLRGAKVSTTATVNGSGVATFTAFVSFKAAGRTIYLQASETPSCNVSARISELF